MYWRCLDSRFGSLYIFFFFFKQKTAYEMQRGLVGSEMCIRDSVCGLAAFKPPALVLDISGAAFIVILCSVGPPLILGLWWEKATTAAAASNILIMTFCSAGSWLYANTVLKLSLIHI
eukprot:TRINITY_DN18075_c0_g1_i2.p2 TRINITY_DN18075_c0_g1~~TRINITY_DN18075_c0_g1_i2.p2  ORF type:complete len:118 (+),score=34.26 TRINITY_DN18075_c0_g1_i2:40-393(+)